jgi:hypothetical protein
MGPAQIGIWHLISLAVAFVQDHGGVAWLGDEMNAHTEMAAAAAETTRVVNGVSAGQH